jgi:hypothetical protein
VSARAAAGVAAAAAVVLAAAPREARAVEGWASAHVTTRLVLAPEVDIGEDGNTVRLAAPWVSVLDADAGLPARGLSLRVRGYLLADLAGDPLGRAGGATGAGGSGSGAALAVATLDWAPPGTPVALRVGRQLLALGTGRVERGDGLRLVVRACKCLTLTVFAGAAAPPAWIGGAPVALANARSPGVLVMGRADFRPFAALAIGLAASHLAGTGWAPARSGSDLDGAAAATDGAAPAAPRSWLSADAALVLGRLGFSGDLAVDPSVPALAAGSFAATIGIGRWSGSLGARRVRPDLFLPVTSLLRAFAGPPRDEAWAAALVGLGALRVGADLAAISYSDGPGLDARLRARLTLGGHFRPALDASAGWLASPQGGYAVARIGARAGNARASASLEATGYLRDAAPAFGGARFAGAVRAALLWRVARWLRAGADAGWASTPWLVYGFTAGLTLEGGVDVVR